VTNTWMADNADVVSGLLGDAIDLFVLAKEMIYDVGMDGVLREGAIEHRQHAVALFYEAAKNLAATDMAALKKDGIKTPLSDGEPPLSASAVLWALRA
jgi:hypothetical protein